MQTRKRQPEVLRPPSKTAYQQSTINPESKGSEIANLITEARNMPEQQRIDRYQEIAQSVDLPDLFDVPVGLRQVVVDMLVQLGGARFTFALSERAERMIEGWRKDKAVTNWPCAVTFDDKGLADGLSLDNGNTWGQTKTAFRKGETISIDARNAVFLWSRYGTSYAKGKPVSRLPSLRGLVQYVGRS